MRALISVLAVSLIVLAGCTSGTDGAIDAAIEDSDTATPTAAVVGEPEILAPTEFEDCSNAGIALGRELTDLITGADESTLTDGFGASGIAQLESREAVLDAAADLQCDPQAFAVGVNDYMLVRLAALEGEDGADGRERLRLELLAALLTVQEARGEGPDAGGSDPPQDEGSEDEATEPGEITTENGG